MNPFDVTSQLVPPVSSLSDLDNSWEAAGRRGRVQCFREGKPGSGAGWGWGGGHKVIHPGRKNAILIYVFELLFPLTVTDKRNEDSFWQEVISRKSSVKSEKFL